MNIEITIEQYNAERRRLLGALPEIEQSIRSASSVDQIDVQIQKLVQEEDSVKKIQHSFPSLLTATHRLELMTEILRVEALANTRKLEI